MLPASPHDPFELTDIPVQHMPKEEHQRIEGLVLCGWRAISLHRQVRQKCDNMLLFHLLWMLLSMKYNKPPNPADVALLCGVAKVSEPNTLPYEV